ncbi:hypothetical protein LV78_003492 [Actinosynnema pretiosum]|nr:hypothetical protein [Actinosynnema pretiosum]
MTPYPPQTILKTRTRAGDFARRSQSTSPRRAGSRHSPIFFALNVIAVEQSTTCPAAALCPVVTQFRS